MIKRHEKVDERLSITPEMVRAAHRILATYSPDYEDSRESVFALLEAMRAASTSKIHIPRYEDVFD